ncbi:MAG: choline dehydrogenase [Pseudomonadota bacterium]|nr:choline dehydrogenase [Pseudomonadota bacterium]
MHEYKTKFDYIIVGAGSAGCALANRLTENNHIKVLLVEAGGSDKNTLIQMPSALSYPMHMKNLSWQYWSEPEAYLNQRKIFCPRGKTLGGSSSINGMAYVRGNALEFNQWHNNGAKNWDYAHCLPYFKKLEKWIIKDTYRGNEGPISVTKAKQFKNPLYQAFINAGKEAGYPLSADYNGAHQEGFGKMQMTINNGIRCSSSSAYLNPIKNRKNLTIAKRTFVHKILFKEKNAIGIKYEKNKKLLNVYCNKEIILSAGAIGSPHLLQLSGIGPKKVLTEAKIPIVHELPGVGQNLQDHLEFNFQYSCTQPITLNSQLKLSKKIKIGAQWLLFKKGLGATNHFEACGFIRSNTNCEYPDIQYHFLPGAMRYDGKSAFSGHGFQVHVGHNKPKSKGRIKVKSNNPSIPPSIRFNYLQHNDDIVGFREAFKLTREIMNQPALDEFRGAEIQPGEHIHTNHEIDAFIRQNVESAYHPSCTCKMGNDELSVVDSNTSVIGITNLRVVDASIFPFILNGNINAPTIMVAERASDLILNNRLLEPIYTQTTKCYDKSLKQRPNQPIR